jgi:hypothetical protein
VGCADFSSLAAFTSTPTRSRLLTYCKGFSPSTPFLPQIEDERRLYCCRDDQEREHDREVSTKGMLYV